MNTGSTIAIVGGVIVVALIVAYAVTRSPAPMVVAPSVTPAPAPAARTDRRSGLGSALETLNQLAGVGAALYSQSTASSKSTGLSAAIGGQK